MKHIPDFDRYYKKNKLIDIQWYYDDFLGYLMPVKPKYGNYYLRGKSNRYRKVTNNRFIKPPFAF